MNDKSVNIINKTSLKEKIRSFFAQDFFKNSAVRWLLTGTLLLNLAGWTFLVIFIRPVDFSIILHYNVYFGVDLIGDWWQAYVLPFMGVVFLIVNFILAYKFYKQKERIASYIFLLASLMIQLGLIIASIGIVMINY